MNYKENPSSSVEDVNENDHGGGTRILNNLLHTDKSTQFVMTIFLDTVSKKRNNLFGFLVIFTIFVLLLYLIIGSKDHREFNI